MKEAFTKLKGNWKLFNFLGKKMDFQ